MQSLRNHSTPPLSVSPISMANKHSALVQKLLKKPIIRKLVRMKLVEQYSYYGHVREYEFSPCSTPRRMPRMSFKKLYTKLLLICRWFLGSRKKEIHHHRFEMGFDELCEAESVDERAERFIQSFYREMRHESSLHLLQLEI